MAIGKRLAGGAAILLLEFFGESKGRRRIFVSELSFLSLHYLPPTAEKPLLLELHKCYAYH